MHLKMRISKGSCRGGPQNLLKNENLLKNTKYLLKKKNTAHEELAAIIRKPGQNGVVWFTCERHLQTHSGPCGRRQPPPSCCVCKKKPCESHTHRWGATQECEHYYNKLAERFVDEELELAPVLWLPLQDLRWDCLKQALSSSSVPHSLPDGDTYWATDLFGSFQH